MSSWPVRAVGSQLSMANICSVYTHCWKKYWKNLNFNEHSFLLPLETVCHWLSFLNGIFSCFQSIIMLLRYFPWCLPFSVYYYCIFLTLLVWWLIFTIQTPGKLFTVQETLSNKEAVLRIWIRIIFPVPHPIFFPLIEIWT